MSYSQAGDSIDIDDLCSYRAKQNTIIGILSFLKGEYELEPDVRVNF